MYFFLFSNVVRCSQKPMEQGDFDRIEQQLLHQLQPNSLKETRGLHGVQGWSTAPLGMYILLSKNINICTRARHLYVTLSTDSAYMLYKAWYVSKVAIVLFVEVCKKSIYFSFPAWPFLYHSLCSVQYINSSFAQTHRYLFIFTEWYSALVNTTTYFFLMASIKECINHCLNLFDIISSW